MQLEEKNEKAAPAGEQITECAFEVRSAANVLAGMLIDGMLPRTTQFVLGALNKALLAAAEQLADVATVVAAKAPRPAPAAPPPSRPHKRPAKPVAAAKPLRPNGAGPAAPSPGEHAAKPLL